VKPPSAGARAPRAGPRRARGAARRRGDPARPRTPGGAARARHRCPRPRSAGLAGRENGRWTRRRGRGLRGTTTAGGTEERRSARAGGHEVRRPSVGEHAARGNPSGGGQLDSGPGKTRWRRRPSARWASRAPTVPSRSAASARVVDETLPSASSSRTASRACRAQGRACGPNGPGPTASIVAARRPSRAGPRHVRSPDGGTIASRNRSRVQPSSPPGRSMVNRSRYARPMTRPGHLERPVPGRAGGAVEAPRTGRRRGRMRPRWIPPRGAWPSKVPDTFDRFPEKTRACKPSDQQLISATGLPVPGRAVAELCGTPRCGPGDGVRCGAAPRLGDQRTATGGAGPGERLRRPQSNPRIAVPEERDEDFPRRHAEHVRCAVHRRGAEIPARSRPPRAREPGPAAGGWTTPRAASARARQVGNAVRSRATASGTGRRRVSDRHSATVTARYAEQASTRARSAERPARPGRSRPGRRRPRGDRGPTSAHSGLTSGFSLITWPS
jgi:hypothetical protein